MLGFVGITLVTIALLVVPQVRSIARENVALPPEARPELTPANLGRALLARGPGATTSHAADLALLRGFEVQVGGRTVMVYVPEQSEPGNWLAAVPGGPLLRNLPVTNWEELRTLSATVAARRQARQGSGPAQDVMSTGNAQSDPVLDPIEPMLTAASEDTVSRSTLLAYVRSSLERRTVALVGSAVLALGLAAALALVLARLIAKPIESVTAAAGRISAGDLSARIPATRRADSGSETERLASSFNTMADSLQRLEESRRVMVADIAHELRTPLTVMRGRLEAIEDGVVELDLAEVRDLHAQLLVLTRLVDDLRTLSLADAGRLSLHLTEVDLAEVARLAGASHAVQAEQKGVSLDVEAPTPTAVRGDKERLLQVIGNLLANAVAHTPAGGSVLLSVGSSHGTARLEVRDTGPGVPPGMEDRIFERFVRTDDARTRAGGGSGIGLAIVKAIVELHGGTVSASNAPGSGAVFSAELPA